MKELTIEQKAKAYDDGICRKLIAFLKQCKAVYGDGFKQFGLDIDDALAWLEKQGEQKPKECMYSKDNYTDEDRKALCDGCEEECEFNKKEKPVSENLEQAIDTYLSTYFGGEQEKQNWPFLKKMAIHFAAWQKEQLMKDAVDGWIEEPECLLWRVISVNLEGDFVLKNKLQDGEPVKVIIIKEE